MNLSSHQQAIIVATAQNYIGRSFNYSKFNCVHFVREVYRTAGITLPILSPTDYPPLDFYLSENELALMPIGHAVFFKRRAAATRRIWTHIAIVYSTNEFIHCSRYVGYGVGTVTVEQMFSIYQLAQGRPRGD